jgi:hypothetical protein
MHGASFPKSNGWEVLGMTRYKAGHAGRHGIDTVTMPAVQSLQRIYLLTKNHKRDKGYQKRSKLSHKDKKLPLIFDTEETRQISCFSLWLLALL